MNGQARLAALAEERPDPYIPLTGRFAGYPAGYLEAIDSAMSALPKQRVQTAANWLAMYHKVPGAPGAAASVDDAVQQLVREFQSGEVEDAALPAKAMSRPVEAAPAPSPAPSPAARGRSPVQLVAGIAVALVVVAGGYVMLGKSDAPGGDTAAAAGSSQTAAQTPEAATPEPALPETTAAALVAPNASGPAATDSEPVSAETATATVTSEPAAEAQPADLAESESAPAAAPETPAATPLETTATEVVEAAEPTEPASETASAADPAADPVEQVIEASASPVAEPVAAAETGAAPADATGPTPAAAQVAFAVWDVELPFTADDRVIGGQPLTIVQRLSPGLDRASAGAWLQQGLLIYSVNGKPTPNAKVLTTAILNAMQVDPDGKARVVVEYAGSDLQRKIDLLTVDAVRIVTLANGVSARTSVVDGAWTTEVTAVARPETTTLKPGDTIFRDKTTTTPLDEATSLEKILGALVDQGVTATEFSIIRDGKVASATMQLAQDGGQ